MNLADLGKTIAKAAPLLGAALAGSGGAAIGSIIAAKFGGDAEDIEGLEHLINADPDAGVKLRQIELAHEAKLQELIVQDRISARSRETDLAKIGTPDNTTKFLAYILTTGLIIFVLSLFYASTNLADSEHDLAMFLAGILAKAFSDVTGYYFGSSKINP